MRNLMWAAIGVLCATDPALSAVQCFDRSGRPLGTATDYPSYRLLESVRRQGGSCVHVADGAASSYRASDLEPDGRAAPAHRLRPGASDLPAPVYWPPSMRGLAPSYQGYGPSHPGYGGPFR